MLLASSVHRFKPQDRILSCSAFNGIGWWRPSPFLFLAIILSLSTLLSTAPTLVSSNCEKVQSGEWKIRAIIKHGNGLRVLTHTGHLFESPSGRENLLHDADKMGHTYFSFKLRKNPTKQIANFTGTSFDNLDTPYFMVAHSTDTLICMAKLVIVDGSISSINVEACISWDTGKEISDLKSTNVDNFNEKATPGCIMADSILINRAHFVGANTDKNLQMMSQIMLDGTEMKFTNQKVKYSVFLRTEMQASLRPMSGVMFYMEPKQFAMLFYNNSDVLFSSRNPPSTEKLNWEPSMIKNTSEVILCDASDSSTPLETDGLTTMHYIFGVSGIVILAIGLLFGCCIYGKRRKSRAVAASKKGSSTNQGRSIKTKKQEKSSDSAATKNSKKSKSSDSKSASANKGSSSSLALKRKKGPTASNESAIVKSDGSGNPPVILNLAKSKDSSESKKSGASSAKTGSKKSDSSSSEKK